MLVHPTRIIHSLTLTALLTTLVATSTSSHAQVLNEDFKIFTQTMTPGSAFGRVIAVKDDITVVGAPSDDELGENTGTAYVLITSTGEQIAQLTPSIIADYDRFGEGIVIGDNIIAVSALNAQAIDGNSGMVFLFDRQTFEEIATIQPSDGASFGHFGYSMAVDGNLLAIASVGNDFAKDPNAVYLYDIDAQSLTLRITPNDPGSTQLFANAVAMENGILAAGAHGDDNAHGNNAGAVYLFDAATGSQLMKIIPNDLRTRDFFGRSVDIHNGILAVGAPGYDAENIEIGTAYLFNATTGERLNKLFPTNELISQAFGETIAMDGDTIAIGSKFDEPSGIRSGSAYLFSMSTGLLITKLVASDGEQYDYFGTALDINNGTVVVGSPLDDALGSAYFFSVPCLVDLNDDGSLNFFDISMFITALKTQDPIADYNNDSRWNFFDVSVFLQAFAAGCQ
ncbi:MAG: hypothetical protein JKX70_00725 [Phycisphaerales bacterium]|nr:hypothetical protein [Phycisphaerales bacterium]